MTHKTDMTHAIQTDPAPFPADDPRAVFAGAVALATSAIGRVQPDQLDRPTPCTEMDVRHLLGHLVMVLRRVAAAGRGDDPFTWPGEVTDVADDGWSDAWRQAAHDVQDAWGDDDLLSRAIALPWATMSGADVMRMYTNEVTVHTWDLARATGQQPAWDDAVLSVAFDAIRVAMPAEGRVETFALAKAEMPPEIPWQDPFGAAIDVADDAPLIDRLVAWNGRTP